MKLLKDLISKSQDTLDEIEWYAEKAHHIKTEHKNGLLDLKKIKTVIF